MRETIIQNKVMAVLNRADSPCRVWRNNVGRYPTEGGGWVQYGLAKGSADLIGIVIATGQFLSVEMKTPKGRLSPEQKTWMTIIQRMNGRALVIRSEEEAEALVSELSNLRGSNNVN